MPIYEYTCRKCGRGFEHLARTLSEPAPKCPACGAARPQKQFSSFSAAVAGEKATPCSEGACPAASSQCGAGGCASGRCPF